MKFGRDLKAYEVPVESPRGNSRSAAAHERVQYYLTLFRCELDQELDELQRLLGLVNFLFSLLKTKRQEIGWIRAMALTRFYVHGPYALFKDVVGNGPADLVGFYKPSNWLIYGCEVSQAPATPRFGLGF